MINIPAGFPGTAVEKKANLDTHSWWGQDGEWVCDRCESKPWHRAAQWPCGATIPRIDVDPAEATGHDRNYLRTFGVKTKGV